MSLKTLIDGIVPFANSWSRPSILKLIGEARDELFEFDGPYNIFIDPSDNKGYPPYLQTVDGTYKYEITAANLSVASLVRNFNGTDYPITCRQVQRVFIDMTRNNEYGLTWVGEPAQYHNVNPYTNQTTRLTIASIGVDSYPALEDGTSAYITFKENPGTTTDKFFVEFLWSLPPLTSESIPLCIPKEYEKAIEDYVIGKIKRRSNGKVSEDETRFYTFWIPRFHQKVLTAGAQANNNNAQPRTC